MTEILNQTAFSVAGTPWCWSDAVLAGVIWGDWIDHERRVRQGLAASLASQAEGDPLEDGALQRAADEFRYERDLIAADETEGWFTQRGLSLKSWLDWLRRELLLCAWATRLGRLTSRYAVDDAAIAARIVDDAFCSGLLERLARRLAGRAALHAELLAHEPADDERSDTSLLNAVPSAPGLEAIPRGVLLAQLGEICAVEDSFATTRARLLTEAAIDARILASPIEWVRVDLSWLLFDDEQAAREAAMCLEVDGLDFAELAASARLEPRTERLYLEDLEGPLRDRLLSAANGEIVGPHALDGQHAIARVIDKRLPRPDDPVLRQRAEASLLERATERALNRHARWLAFG